MKTTIGTFDDVETGILMLLETGDTSATSGWMQTGRRGEYILKEVDVSTTAIRGEMSPKDAFTFDMACDADGEDGRWYTDRHDILLRPVWEILGDKNEIFAYSPEKAVWTGFRRISQLPKFASALGKPFAVYEMHCRTVFGNGARDYGKGIVAFNGKGGPLPIKLRGVGRADTSANSINAILCASIIEDAMRPNAFLASVSDAVTLKFPVAAGAHKDFFSLRDAPLDKAGRRKAILHWVRQHSRTTKNEQMTSVVRHTRGVKELIVDGLTVRLEAN